MLLVHPPVSVEGPNPTLCDGSVSSKIAVVKPRRTRPPLSSVTLKRPFFWASAATVPVHFRRVPVHEMRPPYVLCFYWNEMEMIIPGGGKIDSPFVGNGPRLSCSEVAGN